MQGAETASGDDTKPWEMLSELVEQGDRRDVAAFLDQLSTAEQSLAMDRLDEPQRQAVLELLDAQYAAELVGRLPGFQAVDILEELDPILAAAILDELASNEQADLIGELNRADAETILGLMDPRKAANTRRLSEYDDHVAGGLMVTEYLRYPLRWNAQQVIDDLAVHADEYRDYDVQYAYLIDSAARLKGVLRMRDLLLSSRTQPVADNMIDNPLSVRDTASLEELFEVFDRHHFFGVPVIDVEGVLVGVVHRAAVEQARADQFDSDYMKRQGIVGGEEIRSMPLAVRSRRRLAWLSVNIVLNLMAASVISVYEETLRSVIALAVFLPIISDMSGCSGNQAVAVSLRELSLGLIREKELFRVWIKEIGVGMINGIALGVLVAVVAWVWKGNGYLGLVVGLALAINTMVAVSIGGLIPLILKRFNVDPAIASGPLLTTVTDMCGFFLVLSIAALMLDRLI